MEINKLKKMIFWRLALLPAFLGLIFFLPAGTLRFWEAWVYIAIMVFMVFAVVTYFLKRDPEVMERRLRTKEKETVQKKDPNEPVEKTLAVFCARTGISMNTCRIYYNQLVNKDEIKEK